MAGQPKRKCDESWRAADQPRKKRNTKTKVDLPETNNKREAKSREWWELPAELFDSLSKVHLTFGALRELDRRFWARQSRPDVGSPVVSTAPPPDLSQFARNGGPDLRHLRGYGNPLAQGMAPPSTSKVEPYDPNFGLILTENGVHPTYGSRKPEVKEVLAALALPRPSLSLPSFSEAAFQAFCEQEERAQDKADVSANVMPTILGPGQADRCCSRNTICNRLKPLVDGIRDPKPDIYYGAPPETLDRPVRSALASQIMPSTKEERPIAPNVFIKLKGPSGDAAVAMLQIRHVGSVGCRGMHSLQNYGVEIPIYNGKAYTFSFIYHSGILKLYAHHITAPTVEGGRPEFHTSQLRAYAMTNDRETFIQGASALRNVLDLAERYRANFIKDANARAASLLAN